MAKQEDVPTPPPFAGFSSPNYTQVPDQLLDYLLPDLSEAELKVLLYIVRRTFGFKKEADTISLRQLCSGITTKDGRQLDRGTGLSKSGVTKALVSLRQKGILVRFKNTDSQRGSMPTTYRLRMVGEPLDLGETPVHTERHPLSTSVDTPRVSDGSHGLSTDVDTQETVEQHRETQERAVEYSTGPASHFDEIGTRTILVDYISDFAREFNDQAPLRSSVSRAVNLCRASGLDIETFIDKMYEARARTKEYTGLIRSTASGDGFFKRKSQMAYFFSILTDLVGATVEE